MIGLKEKIRFIFGMSFNVDLPANVAPIAEPMSHDPKNEPIISSYPPVIFIISLISSNWMEELTKPVIKRLTCISVEVSFDSSWFSGFHVVLTNNFP